MSASSMRTTHRRQNPLRATRARGLLLFVYGTLRPAAGTPMAAWLAARAEHLGAARTPGRLYDLGDYPGFTDAREPGELVHGDLYRLRSPATWRTLDEYENGAAGNARFVCVRRAVDLDGGQRVDACLYLYRGPLRGARRIASGDWLAPSERGIMYRVGR